MNLNKTFVFLFLFLSFLALSIYVFKYKEVSHTDKHSSLKENILKKTKEAKKIEKNKRTPASKKDSEEKRTNTPAEKRKEKLGIKPIDGTYKSLSFSIADVSEEEINRWRVQDEEPEGFALSSLVLKVNKRALLENEKLQIPLNKKEFLEVKRLDFDLTNEDSFVWQGSSDSENKLDFKVSSNVLLSWYKGHLTGYLNLSREGSYQISYFKKDHIIIKKLNPSSFPKGKSCIIHENKKTVGNKNDIMYKDSFSLNLSKNELQRASENVRDKKIRILFLYRGNEYKINTITSKVNAYISSLNTIFETQGISQSPVFEKAGIEVTKYDSGLIEDTLNKVKKDSDVEKLRHDYEADVVSIIFKNHDNVICGAANYIGGAFLISAVACDPGYTFEHEMGHTLGLDHERKQVRAEGRSEESSYGYGYYDTNKVTLMSYYCWNGSRHYECNWAKYYSSSSPNLIGNDQNDAARHIKDNLSIYKNRYENRPIITTNLNPTYNKSPGSTVTFSVSATGANLSYQWYEGNKKLTGETSSTLSIANLNNSHAGNYKLKISNYFGSIFSKVATLVVGNRPTITTNLNLSYQKSPGESITFSVSATGTNLSYQWYKDNKKLTGETNSTLKLTNLNSSHAGNYKVEVKNNFGSVFSKTATLNVGNRPTITTNLNLSYQKSPGESITFSVSATGTNLSYQWYKGNSKLIGKTNSTLKLTNLSSSHAGNYKVEVKNNFGSVFSKTATLNVGNRPTITTNLNLSYQKSPGESITFSVSATGTNLSYQWYKGNSKLIGKTNSTLKLTNLSSSHAGNYKVEVKNNFGSVFSKTATLNVGNRPTITTNLNLSYQKSPGESITFSVSATGTNLSYQWYKGNSKLIGKTNSTLKLTNLSSSHAGNYKVEVKNNFGSVFSKTATLNVGNRPTITTNLNLSYQKSPGESITFSVSATGTNLSYQWYKGNSKLIGKTNSTLKLTNLNSSHAGNYKVEVKNNFGSVFSKTATLNVGNRPTITTNLNLSYQKSPGESITFSVSATGTNLSYQWYKGNSKLIGKTNSTLKLTNLSSSHAGNYKVEVKNNFGSVFSKTATLNVGNRPTITTNLNLSYQKSPGESITFSVSATGTNLSYQWYKGNSKLIGKTNSTLKLTNLSSSHAGNYKVEVKNNFGSVFSKTATLNVGNRPTITTNLNLSYQKSPGESITFSVSATGTNLSYQWYKGNSKLIGKTNSTLKLTNLSSSHAGNYKVEVKNNFGSVFSKTATLNVGNRPTITTNLNLSYQKSPGESITFSVSATGTNLSYQWYKGNSKLIGKTNSTLKLTNLSSSHAGNYKVEVKNNFGSVFSKTATLNVGNRPTITTNLNLSYQKSPGESITFSVSATGTNLSYQWYKGNSKLIGKTNSTLKLTNLSSSHAGNYKVEVKNNFGSVFSKTATLNVGNRPTITTNLNLSYKKLTGSTVTFSVTATGTGSLSYQWYQNAKTLSGKTNSTLKLTNLSSSHAGKYKVKVSNAFGSTYSRETTLNVGNRPTITTNLNLSYKKLTGSTVTFLVTATGTGSLSYQWYQNAKTLSGKTNSTLKLTNLNSSHAGNYKVEVKNAFGSIFSREAILSVGNRPTITTNLNLSYKKLTGSTVTFSVTATGTGSLSYQWYKGNSKLSGKTNRVLSIANLNSSHAGNYKVEVSNAFASIFSREAILSVGNRPTITTNLNLSYKKLTGSTVTFSVTATGTGSLSYQWYKGNSKLSGKTNRVLSIANLNSSHAGNYKVEVSNAFASIFSREAILIVGNPPAITTDLKPSYKFLHGSTSAVLFVIATGTNLSYQWYKGNDKLNGETNSALILTNLNSSHAGNYKVKVSNDFGSIFSRAARLELGKIQIKNLNPNYVLRVLSGSDITLSVSATGSGTLSYQWYKNYQALNGKTSSSLKLTKLQISQRGLYTVEVKNDFGSIFSNLATLSVGNLPIITTNLNLSYKKSLGSTVTFSVSATGTNLSYQWYKGNSKLNGKTNRVLSIANLNSSHAGNYKVEVKNDFGSIFSNLAALSVGNRPIITTNLNLSYKKSLGSTVTFSVSATGTNLSYQWYKDNKKLNGETNSTLKRTNLNSSHAGNYKVEVKNDFGSIFSNLAALSVGNRPIITTNLNLSYKKSLGSTVTFSVSATGTNLSYQWYKGNRKLNGETNSTLKRTNLNSSHAGNYKVEVKNNFGSIFSKTATLVVGNRPTITSFTSGTYSKSPGSTVTFSVSATGTNLSYQWYKGNSKLNGKTNRVLSIANLNSSHAGNYKVEVKNDFGSIFSNLATLSVGNRPIITTNLNLSYKKSLGSTVTFSVSATGTNLSYQWYKDNKKLTGETSSTLSIANLNNSHAGNYKLKISNYFGSIFSNLATLSVGNRPIITTNLNLSYKKSLGSTVTFSVSATGTNLSYQWYKGNSKLNGKTNRVLSIANLNSSHAGNYKVEVKNDFGSIFSNLAALSVGKRPIITTNLNLSYKKSLGSTVTFSVSATGAGSLSYQWYKGNSKLNGKTNRVLSIANLNNSHAGNYKVEVKNAFGSIFSNLAELIVGKSPTVTIDLNPVHMVLSGSDLTLSVIAIGSDTLSYQWYKDNNKLNGKISSSLILRNFNQSQEGYYRVEVKNDYGKDNSITSRVQMLLSNLTDISIYLTPRNLITKTNESFILRVDTKQTINRYIWYRDETYIATTSEPFYTVETGNVSQLFNYKVVVEVEGKNYSSNIATVSVIKPLTRNISSENVFDLDTRGGFEFSPQRWYEDPSSP